mgnify:CR=1 FL=1
MTYKLSRALAYRPELTDYSGFAQIDGEHPLQRCPNAYILYQVRRRTQGKLAFFNFSLAKEMGLLTEDHAEIINQELERIFLQTFSLQIINEYDVQNKVITKDEILPQQYMATRYLQLQHPDKRGLNSGDGRSIWNGLFSSKHGQWDITSCGTGATRLSPACNINKKFYQTGDPTVSYGCGLSDLDEGLSTLFFSEVLNRNHYSTERLLCIIEFPNKTGIHVRANKNLLRPGHVFRALKQGKKEELRPLLDYYIQRQVNNCEWENVPVKPE